MKKRTIKIRLHRETLRNLDPMDEVFGGAGITMTCYPNPCEFSRRATCTTCRLTCTSNLC